MKKIILLLSLILITGCSIGGNTMIEMHTTEGIMKFEMYDDKAPTTVKNFVDLSKDGFYEDVIFHRVINGFMIQGGDPSGTGSGGPGYTIDDEFHPELRHDKKGVLSMANAGPNTGGSQFFITAGPQPHLDDMHSVFGQLVEGEEVLDAILNKATDANNRPLNPVSIEKIVVK